MSEKTAWTVEDAMKYLKAIGLDIVDASTFKPYYLKRTYAPGVNHWCVPCWEFKIMEKVKYLRMDQAELFEPRPDKLTPIHPGQGVRLHGGIQFRFLKRKDGKYYWQDVDEPSQIANGALWEEIIAPAG